MLNLLHTWKANRCRETHQRLLACWNSLHDLGIEDIEAIYRNVQRNHAFLDANSSTFAVFKAAREVRALEKVIYHQKKLQEIAGRQ